MTSKLHPLAVLAFTFLCLAEVPPARADQPAPISELSTEQLIDMLVELDKPVPGVADGGMFDSFYADGGPINFEGGLLPVQQLIVPLPMRELARRGQEALPMLIAHLNDDRPTHLVVGALLGTGSRNPFRWSVYGAEYDPKLRSDRRPSDWSMNGSRPPSTGYTVKVGDVCYALIGEIVNRHLFAVRYQPSGGVVINSPIEKAMLRQEVEHDWRGTTRVDLARSLLFDLSAARDPDEARGALERIRFYFPAAYEGLSGADLEKRRVFEASGRAAAQ